MKYSVTLTIASVLSILLMTFHLTDDILHHGGTTQTGFLASVLILVVWLCGTLVLAERLSGYVIIILGSLLGVSIPVLHTTVAGGVVNGGIAGGSVAFFYVWTLMALGVSATFSLILSVRGLWSL